MLLTPVVCDDEEGSSADENLHEVIHAMKSQDVMHGVTPGDGERDYWYLRQKRKDS